MKFETWVRIHRRLFPQSETGIQLWDLHDNIYVAINSTVKPAFFGETWVNKVKVDKINDQPFELSSSYGFYRGHHIFLIAGQSILILETSLLKSGSSCFCSNLQNYQRWENLTTSQFSVHSHTRGRQRNWHIPIPYKQKESHLL